MLRTASCLLALAVLGGGCAYPRRTTSLTAAVGPVDTTDAPASVYMLRIVSARIPELSRGALRWDDDEVGLPDPFVRVYRDDELVYESSVLDDTLRPEWDERVARNLYVRPDADYRFEVWDSDQIGADPIGVRVSHGLPANVVVGAEASLLMESGATLTVELERPRGHRGVGITLYEVRPDSLVVIELETHSPAGRAGLAPGDEILAIGDETVHAMGAQRAAGALSMAAERQSRLTIRDIRGETRTVTLDQQPTWLLL